MLRAYLTLEKGNINRMLSEQWLYNKMNKTYRCAGRLHPSIRLKCKK